MIVDVFGGEKGGTGKTAFATNLAVCLAIAGHRVLLWDADPQRSTWHWFCDRRARSDAASLPQLDCRQTNAELLPKERGIEMFQTLRENAGKYDRIVIDCAGA